MFCSNFKNTLLCTVHTVKRQYCFSSPVKCPFLNQWQQELRAATESLEAMFARSFSSGGLPYPIFYSALGVRI